MNRGLSLVATAALLMGAVGCKRKFDAPPEVAPPASTARPPEGVGLDGVNMPVSQLLGTERESRPTGTPKTEQVFAAFQQAGLTLTNKTQVLGRTIGARFCENAHTPSGVVFSVCEFNDAATASRGRDYSLRTFGKALPDRDLLIKDKTLLTITRGKSDDGTKAESVKASHIFQGLSG